MYVNSSLTAQRIQKFVLVLGSFGLETALTREKINKICNPSPLSHPDPFTKGGPDLLERTYRQGPGS